MLKTVKKQKTNVLIFFTVFNQGVFNIFEDFSIDSGSPAI